MNLKNSKFDETQKLKLWWNSKIQIVMKLKKINCDELKTQMWWKSKTSILMKLKKSNCDETEKLKVWWN